MPLGVRAQDFEGIWIISHKVCLIYEIDAPLLDSSEHTVVNQSISPDSSYQVEFGVMKIKKNGQLEIFDFSAKKPAEIKYSIQNDSIFYTRDIKGVGVIKAKGVMVGPELVFEEYLNHHFYRKTVWKAVQEDPSPSLSNVSSSTFNSLLWSTEITDDSGYGDRIYFTSDSTATITVRDSNKSFTGYASWEVLESFGHKFLVLNYAGFSPSAHHLKEKEGSAISMTYYEQEWFSKKTPASITYKLSPQELPPNNEIKNLKEHLVGEWEASLNPIPLDSMSYDSLLQPSFKILFTNKNRFRITKSGTVYSNGDGRFFKEVEEGTFEISLTGDYINLLIKDSGNRYLTIAKIEMDRVTFFLEVKALGYFPHKVELTELNLKRIKKYK